MWTARFWLSLAERALKTFAQVMVAQLLVGDRVLGLLDVNWPTSLSVAGLATAVSALTSIASAGIGPDGSPSLVGEPAKVPETVLNSDPDEVVHTGDNPVDRSSGRHVDDGEPRDIPVRRLTQRRREPCRSTSWSRCC
jgi:hypothetical protein